jgi:hypothetical protein
MFLIANNGINNNKKLFIRLWYTRPFIMYSGITKIYYRKTVGHVFIAKHIDVHIPARRKSYPLPLWGSSVPEHSVTGTVDRACVWKWPTTEAMAPEVPWHYVCPVIFFFGGGYVQDRVFVPLLPRDLADLKARIIAAVKTIDAPMFTRVCGKNLNIVSMCAVSPVVHTSNISSCQKRLFQCSCGCEQFH